MAPNAGYSTSASAPLQSDNFTKEHPILGPVADAFAQGLHAIAPKFEEKLVSPGTPDPEEEARAIAERQAKPIIPYRPNPMAAATGVNDTVPAENIGNPISDIAADFGREGRFTRPPAAPPVVPTTAEQAKRMAEGTEGLNAVADAYQNTNAILPIGQIVRQQVAKAPDDPSKWFLNSLQDAGVVSGDVIEGLTTPENLAIMAGVASAPAAGRVALAKVLVDLGFSADMAHAAGEQISSGYESAQKGDFREAGRQWAAAGATFILALETAKSGARGIQEARTNVPRESPEQQIDQRPSDAPPQQQAQSNVSPDATAPPVPTGPVLDPNEVEVAPAGAAPTFTHGDQPGANYTSDQLKEFKTKNGIKDEPVQMVGGETQAPPANSAAAVMPLKRGQKLKRGQGSVEVNGERYAYDKTKTSAAQIQEHAERGELWKLTGERPPETTVARAAADAKGDVVLKPEEVEIEPKEGRDAISERGPEKVLRGEQEKTGVSGSEREGVGAGEQGQETARAQANAPGRGEAQVKGEILGPESAALGKARPANVVVREVRDRSGNTLGTIIEPHDGTMEGIRTSAEKLSRQAETEFPNASNVESRTGATDETGAPKWAVSPNGRHISEAGTADARYTGGDLSAKTTAASAIRKQASLSDRQRVVEERAKTAVDNNPQEFLDRYKKLPATKNGRYISADVFKELFPEYASSPETRTEFTQAVHNSSAVLSGLAFDQALSKKELGRPDVEFITGTPGSGKTTAYGEDVPGGSKAVFETNLGDQQLAEERIQKVLDSGHRPVVHYVHADPIVALNRAIDRAGKEGGRIVSIDDIARIATSVPESLLQLKAVFGKKLRIRAIDNSVNAKEPRIYRGAKALEFIATKAHTLNRNDLRQQLAHELERRKDAGEVPDHIYREVLGTKPGIHESGAGRTETVQEQRDDGRRGGGLPSQGEGRGHQANAGPGEAPEVAVLPSRSGMVPTEQTQHPGKQYPEGTYRIDVDANIQSAGARLARGEPSPAFKATVRESSHEAVPPSEIPQTKNLPAYQRDYFKAALQPVIDAWIATVNGKGDGAENFAWMAKKSAGLDKAARPAEYKKDLIYIKVPEDGHFLIRNNPAALLRVMKGADRGFSIPKESVPRRTVPRSPKEFDHEKYIVMLEKEIADINDRIAKSSGSDWEQLRQERNAAEQNLAEAKKADSLAVGAFLRERGNANDFGRKDEKLTKGVVREIAENIWHRVEAGSSAHDAPIVGIDDATQDILAHASKGLKGDRKWEGWALNPSDASDIIADLRQFAKKTFLSDSGRSNVLKLADELEGARHKGTLSITLVDRSGDINPKTATEERFHAYQMANELDDATRHLVDEPEFQKTKAALEEAGYDTSNPMTVVLEASAKAAAGMREDLNLSKDEAAALLQKYFRTIASVKGHQILDSLPTLSAEAAEVARKVRAESGTIGTEGQHAQDDRRGSSGGTEAVPETGEPRKAQHETPGGGVQERAGRAGSSESSDRESPRADRGGEPAEEVGTASSRQAASPLYQRTKEESAVRALVETAYKGIKAPAEAYDNLVNSVLEATNLGKPRPEIRKYDAPAADLALKMDAGAVYHKAMAEAISQRVVGPMVEKAEPSDSDGVRARKNAASRDRMKGFHFLADAQNREWLQEAHPEEYERWTADDTITQALREYKPFENDLRDAVKELGGETIDQDYLRRVMDFVTSGIDKAVAADRPGMGKDNVVSPQVDRSKQRTADASYYWEHGVFDFGPSFEKRWVEVMSKVDEHRLAVHAMSRGTRIESGDELPPKIYYNGEEFYRSDIAQEILEVQKMGKSAASSALANDLGVEELPTPKNVKTYALYHPLRGARFENAALNLARGATGGAEAEVMQARGGQLQRMAGLKYAVPREIADALNDAERKAGQGRLAKIATALLAPVTRVIRQQIVGLGYGIPHMGNILRKVMQQVPGGVANPYSWAQAFKVAFNRELKARAINGVDDPTYNNLLRHAGISEGALPEYKHYVEGNLNPVHWKEFQATLGNAFREGGKAGNAVTVKSALAGAPRLAFEPLNRFSEAGHSNLFKRGGIDQRARIWLADSLRDRSPRMSDPEIAYAVNQALGRYNRASWTDLQRGLAPFMLFPGWDFSSVTFALKHPIKTTAPPALLMWLANRAFHAAGMNDDKDKNDLLRLHVGNRSYKSNLISDNMGNHLLGWALRGGKALLDRKGARDVVGESVKGLPQDVGSMSVELANPMLSGVASFGYGKTRAGSGQDIVPRGDFKRRGKVLPNKGAEDMVDFGAREMFPLYDTIRGERGNKDSAGDHAISASGRLAGVTTYKKKRR